MKTNEEIRRTMPLIRMRESSLVSRLSLRHRPGSQRARHDSDAVDGESNG